jgi:hypothetical protein
MEKSRDSLKERGEKLTDLKGRAIAFCGIAQLQY